MNKRQRKKQKKKIEQQQIAKYSKFKGSQVNVSGGLASYMAQFYEELEQIEFDHNDFLDNYVIEQATLLAQQEAKGSLSEFGRIKEYDYYGKLTALGLNMDEADLETVPDMGRVRIFVETFVGEYYDFSRGRGIGYVKIQEEMGGESRIYDAMTEWYVQNQFNPKRLSRSSDFVRQFAEKLYREYKEKKGRELFGRRNFM